MILKLILKLISGVTFESISFSKSFLCCNFEFHPAWSKKFDSPPPKKFLLCLWRFFIPPCLWKFQNFFPTLNLWWEGHYAIPFRIKPSKLCWGHRNYCTKIDQNAILIRRKIPMGTLIIRLLICNYALHGTLIFFEFSSVDKIITDHGNFYRWDKARNNRTEYTMDTWIYFLM